MASDPRGSPAAARCYRHGALVGIAPAALCLRQRGELLRLRDSRRNLAVSDRNARERYDNAAAAVLSIAADCRARSANRALVNLLGYPGERELFARDLRDQTYA